MTPGYLIVETNPQSPGLVRLAVLPKNPETVPRDPEGPRIVFVSRFNDSEAALMHTHAVLRRRLVDIDAGLYRAPPDQAIAAVRAVDLRHHEVYLDPDISEALSARIEALQARLIRRKQWTRQVFETIGYIALAMLIGNLFLLSH